MASSPEEIDKINELLKDSNNTISELTRKQERTAELLSRALNSDKKNTDYINLLTARLGEINGRIEQAQQAFAQFHADVSATAGNVKGLDDQMFKDLYKYQEIYVKTFEQIGKLRESLREEKNRLDELNARYSDHLSGGNFKAGTSQDIIYAYNKEKEAIKTAEKDIKQMIDQNMKFRHDTYNAIQNKYGGPNSDAVNYMNSFNNDPNKQRAFMEQQKQLQRDLINGEKELNEAYKEGNAVLRDRERAEKIIKKVWEGGVKGAKTAANYWIKYNERAIADSKRLGITSREQAQAYNRELMEGSKQLSRNFGLSYEEAKKLKTKFSEVTGKAAILNQSQMEDVAAATSLMGKENVDQAIKMMDNMGSTSEQAMELLGKTYLNATRSGLDGVKASETLVQNLSLANKLPFQNGVDGLSKMSILSQHVKLDLQQVANVAEKFSTIEGAIQGSAQLQMLGGVGAIYGGNPMEMLYEATSDPEALYKRMVNMASTGARFDRNTGEAKMSPLEMRLSRERAKAMGMDPDKFIESIKTQAKNTAIESDLRNSSVWGKATDAQKQAIENKAQYSKENGWTVTYMNGSGKTVTSNVNDLTKEALDDIAAGTDAQEDIRAHVRQIAKDLVSFKDREQSWWDNAYTNVAQQGDGIMNKADNAMTDGAQNKGLMGSLWNGTTQGVSGMLGFGGTLMVGGALAMLGSWAGKKLLSGSGRVLGSPLTWWRHLREGGNISHATPTPSSISPPNPGPSGGLNTGANVGGAATRTGRSISNLRKLAKMKNMARIAGKGALFADVAIEAGMAAYDYYQAENENKSTQSQLDAMSNLSGVNGQSRFSNDYIARRREEANNKQKRDENGAIWQGIGGVAGGLAGIAAGAATGAAIGSMIPIPGLGTALGALVGAAGAYYGGKLGRNIGESRGPQKGIEESALDEINGNDADDNVKKIVLPIQSIDYNVSLIANQLGILSARPARGNVYMDAEIAGETKLEAVPIGGTQVAQQSSNVYQPQSIGSGNLNLNVTGTIELNLGGKNAGKITAKEVANMIETNSDLRNKIIELVIKADNRRENISGKQNKNTANSTRNRINR